MPEKKISDLLHEEKTSWFQDNVVANAPLIIAVFANFVVIFADYRAYDVMYTLTGSWWKALAASLACAVPFILWEIGWQYNHTTEGWRSVSLAMAGLAFATSIVLGVADYVGFTGQWADLLLGGVVVLTGVHTVMGFLYYYNDPDVARRRRKAQAMAKMQDQQLNAEVASMLLSSGSDLLAILSGLEKKYDPQEVKKVLAILQGQKIPDEPRSQQVVYAHKPAVSMPALRPQDGTGATKTTNPTGYTIQDLENASGLTLSEIRDEYKDFQSFKSFCKMNGVPEEQIGKLWGKVGNFQKPPR